MKYQVHMLAFEDGKVREVEVPDKEISGDRSHDLERIFHWGQNDFQPQNMCSVSAGDIVEYNSGFFMVMMSGYKEMTAQQFEQYKKSNNKFRFMYAFDRGEEYSE